MGDFWGTIDTLVGLVPIAGEIKNSVQAAIAYEEGDDVEASRKAKEVLIGLVADVIIYGTGGLSEGLNLLKLEEAATNEGFAMMAGKSGGKSVVGAGEKMSTTKMATKYEENVVKNACTKMSAAAIIEIQERARRNKDPKRGHHVINNGVKRIFRNIIEKFINDDIYKGYFGRKNYQSLEMEGRITSTLRNFHDKPLPENIVTRIECMLVNTPTGEKHTDDNDQRFSATTAVILAKVVLIIGQFFRWRTSNHDAYIEWNKFVSMLKKVAHVVDKMNYHRSNGDFVDNQALGWWLKGGGSKRDFEHCQKEVRSMYASITTCAKDHQIAVEKTVTYQIANELFKISDLSGM